jgi:hypothetical protein
MARLSGFTVGKSKKQEKFGQQTRKHFTQKQDIKFQEVKRNENFKI